MTAHRRGEVVWYPAIFADYHRPYLIVSMDARPYRDEYVGLAITTVAGALRQGPVDRAAGALATFCGVG